MNKAILLIDMPERCSDCRFKDSVTNHIDNSIEFICKAKNELIICDIDKRKDEDCPLKPMPQKLNDLNLEDTIIKNFGHEIISLEKAIKYAKQKGYNDCIDEILGEEE